ncbi:hypothetical protein L6R50_16720 [Myxococcota bacterium]|nr:hypothetical protein [Myxococcota bacterium]
MAQPDKGLQGRRVQVLLRDPLVRGRNRMAEKQLLLHQHVIEVVGTVTDHVDGGLLMRIDELWDERGDRVDPPPFAEVLVPASKIDLVVLA